MGIIERMRLDGKVAFVTGGAQGIGKAIATAFAEAGADVAIVDINIEKAKVTAKEIAEATGKKIIALYADVTNKDDVTAFVDEIVKTFGHLDIAFCNAGICNVDPVEDMDFADWSRTINVNLNGVFLTAQAASKVMLKQGKGSIINTASMSAHIVNRPFNQSAYNTSKAGVVHFTKSMAVEFAPRGVRVNCISPGYIRTDIVDMTQMEAMERMTPQGHIGTVEDLQAAVVYLAGDASSYTTGCDMIIDGGYTCV